VRAAFAILLRLPGRTSLSAGAAGALVMLAACAAAAQSQVRFPDRPVRFVVPFAAGSQSDVLARTLAPKLAERWGQPVVIDSRTGAGGAIGTALVAKATPDGHTLLITSSGFVVSAALQASLPYDPIRDFAGVTQLGYSTSALVVAPTLGVKSVKELIALAQARPGTVLFSSSGFGGGSHMLGERFRLTAGIRVGHVGFKGASEAVIEVLAGRVQFCIQSLGTVLPHVRDGRLVALAVVTPERSPLLPEVPAMAEVLPGYERDGSFPLLAPAGTPRPVLARISTDVARTLELPDIRERLQAVGFVPAPTTPQELDRIVREQIETFARVVRLAGLKPK